MKRIMLVGPSQCGKMSFTQYMRGETPHYQKTQAIAWSPTIIGTPGEYLENRCLYSALLISACEVNVIALVFNADTPWSPFSPGFTEPVNRPITGLVTRANLASPQHISLAEGWLVQTGAQKVFATNAPENTRVDKMFTFLNVKEPSCPTK